MNLKPPSGGFCLVSRLSLGSGIVLPVSDVYRLAASILLLRPLGEGKYELLLLHKPRKKDAWQLPQGGVEAGESMEDAAVRELKEEASIEGVTLLGASRECYQYDFPQSFRRFRPDNVCGQKIGYVFALTDKDAKVKVDAKEVDKHVWVGLSELPRYIKRDEYLALTQRLYQEALRHIRA